MTSKTASISWSNTELIVVYYSRGSVVPALLAAALHRDPEISLEQGLRCAAVWKTTHLPEEASVMLKPFSRLEGGYILFVATANAAPGLVERTLMAVDHLFPRGGTNRLLVAPLPGFRRPRREIEAGTLWPEITAVVGQVRLQLALREARV